MENYSKAATGDYLSEAGRPPGIDPFETFGYRFKLPDTGHWQSSTNYVRNQGFPLALTVLLEIFTYQKIIGLNT
jgi:hypothetical protein